MRNQISKLFEPTWIGQVEIKNRIAMAPMGIGGLVSPDGSPSPRAIEYYIERARGGVGLIITGVFRVENDIEQLKGPMQIVSRSALGSLAELREAIHALGSKIFVQLTAGFGRVANPVRVQGSPISASAVPYYWSPRVTCRELKTEEVERLVKAFGDAAEILAAAGIDGVELHGHEGYLFDQFTTAFWNRRTDKYGGTLEGRLRLPIEVLREIKDRAGQTFSVQYRFGLKHFIKDLNSGALIDENFTEAGRDLEEGLQMAKRLEAAGFDSLHVDAGCYDSWYFAHPPVYQKAGYLIELAAQAKNAVHIPVIAVGKLSSPELAERVIAEGKADMVAIGKALLADPFWVRKIEEGCADRIRPCIGCHDGCMGRVTKGKPLSCAVNPATGRERLYGLEKTNKPKKVLIIGGGVAGLEAARVAYLRGHKVILIEKSKSLGGHLLEATIPDFKSDLKRYMEWLQREIAASEIDLRTGITADIDLIDKENPEVTIIATGSIPIPYTVPGMGKFKVLTALDLFLRKEKAGERVLVVGGGLIGCEVALWLAQQGKNVTIVEILKDILIAGIPVQHMNRLMLLNLLRFHNVEIITHTTLLELADDTGILIDKNFRKSSCKIDTVVLAVGLKPEQELYQSLRGKIPNLFLVGDSRKPQNIMNAIWDAYEVARMI